MRERELAAGWILRIGQKTYLRGQRLRFANSSLNSGASVLRGARNDWVVFYRKTRVYSTYYVSDPKRDCYRYESIRVDDPPNKSGKTATRYDSTMLNQYYIMFLLLPRTTRLGQKSAVQQRCLGKSHALGVSPGYRSGKRALCCSNPAP